jgi:hypothetical protein
MAYDSDRGVTVFFGGEIGVTGSEKYFNDTWEYDGTNQWRQIIVPDSKPLPRSFHAMAYDPVRKRVVLYGGYAGGVFGLDDTWEYTGDGVNGVWTLAAGNPGDEGLAGSALVWDPALKSVVRVGGIGNPFEDCATCPGPTPRTGLWNGTSWVTPIPSGSDQQNAWGVGAAFDTSRAVVVLVGGYNVPTYRNPPAMGQVLELTADLVWQADTAISPRVYPAAAYDEMRQRVVVVGGDSGQAGTEDSVAELVPGTAWVPLPSIPPLPSNGADAGRAGAAMVYDSRRGVFVLMGGAGAGAEQQVPGDITRGPGSRFSDTWELMPERVAISQGPTNTTVGVCQTAAFAVTAAGNGTVHYQWRLDGQPLFDDDHFQGTHTSLLVIQAARYAYEGNYDVMLYDDCGPLSTVTSKAATLALSPGLQWVLRTTNGPTARTSSAMAYDSKRHVTVLFGGLGFHPDYPNQLVPLNDLWEWNGAAWTQRIAGSFTNGWASDVNGRWHLTYQGGQPVYRISHVMAYDNRRGRVVLFGGRASDPSGLDTLFNDTWEWDGGHWYFRTTNGPPSRFAASMAYDSGRGVTVLYGGYDPHVEDYGVVWEWDGFSWKSIAPTNGPASNYSQVVAGHGLRQLPPNDFLRTERGRVQRCHVLELERSGMDI